MSQNMYYLIKIASALLPHFKFLSFNCFHYANVKKSEKYVHLDSTNFLDGYRSLNI